MKQIIIPEDCTRAILLLSGGIDSTTVLAALAARQVEVLALIFDYGQRLQDELEYALENAGTYGAAAIMLRSHLDDLLTGNAITNVALDLPELRTTDQIAAAGTPPSYVPFRNGIFFAYAVALAEQEGVPYIFGGCNGLASGNYPDDTEDFAYAMTGAARHGTAPDFKPTILVPLARHTKAEVVAAGLALGVDYERTTSCYLDLFEREHPEVARHCGWCDSCVQRAEAMAANGLTIDGGLP